MEEAVRLVEANGGESVVLTLGPAEAVEQLRDAWHRHRPGDPPRDRRDEWDAQATAGAIVEAIRVDEAAYGAFDIVLFGNESADSGGYQVGIRVARALGRPARRG